MSTISMISKSKKTGTLQQYTAESGVSASLQRNAQHGTSSTLVDSVDPDIPRVSAHVLPLFPLKCYLGTDNIGPDSME